MTDKPTPTDAELKALWQIHAADIGGIFYYARAVLAKWGQPAQAAEPVARVPLTDEQTKALMQAHRTAMLMTCKARVPECGEFAAIAQALFSLSCYLATANALLHRAPAAWAGSMGAVQATRAVRIWIS